MHTLAAFLNTHYMLATKQTTPSEWANGHEHVSPKTVSFCTILSHSIWKYMEFKNFYNIAFELHIETFNWLAEGSCKAASALIVR